MRFEELCGRFADMLNILDCDGLYCDDYCFDDNIEADVPDVLNPTINEDCLSIDISSLVKSQNLDINLITGIQLTFRNYKYHLKVQNVIVTDIMLALISVGMYKTAIRCIFNNASCNLLDAYSVFDTILYLEEMSIPVGIVEMYLNYCKNFADKYIHEYDTSNEKLRNIILNTFIIKYDHINVLLESLASIEYKVALMNFVNNNLIDGMEDIIL